MLSAIANHCTRAFLEGGGGQDRVRGRHLTAANTLSASYTVPTSPHLPTLPSLHVLALFQHTTCHVVGPHSSHMPHHDVVMGLKWCFHNSTIYIYISSPSQALLYMYLSRGGGGGGCTFALYQNIKHCLLPKQVT